MLDSCKEAKNSCKSVKSSGKELESSCKKTKTSYKKKITYALWLFAREKRLLGLGISVLRGLDESAFNRNFI
ncbi:hypothetical protein BBI08_09085 [Planococcus halocryophilus]|uniref:Uncharacterized protein n=1 Tax=Planococcus halocryophilus TaxID=1215089 RepID=A0A1C7DR39_9BACL|nr:hypothetical protein BBI08_09085 [Planococcus halocryophilus]